MYSVVIPVDEIAEIEVEKPDTALSIFLGLGIGLSTILISDYLSSKDGIY